MGEQTNNKLYISTDGVVFTEFIEIPTITFKPPATSTEHKLDILKNTQITLHVKLPKMFRCKNRKRFIKLLMSIGIPRNVAQKVKAEANQSYAGLWLYMVMQRLC